MDLDDYRERLYADLANLRSEQYRRHQRDARVRAWAVATITAMFVILGALDLVFRYIKDEAPPPPVEQPDTLAGCPRVGGEYTHDGQWLTCYACSGETPVCLLIGGAK